MRRKEWIRKYYSDYIYWLEDTLFNFIKKDIDASKPIKKKFGLSDKENEFIEFLLEKDQRDRKNERAFLFNLDCICPFNAVGLYDKIIEDGSIIEADRKEIERLQILLAEILYIFGYNSNNIRKIFDVEELIIKYPFLKSYPIGLLEDGYNDKDIKEINEWEQDTLYTLLETLGKDTIRSDDYCAFFDQIIKPCKDWFLPETYQKMLPQNIQMYFCCRINIDIPWQEMGNHSENMGIHLTSLIEDRYLDYNNPIESFEHLVGQRE